MTRIPRGSRTAQAPEHAGSEPDADVSATLPLPELHQGSLCAADLATYVAELEVCAEVREVRIKQSGPARSQAPDPSALHELAEQLLAGHFGALQILYTTGEQAYCDTLMRTGPDLIRLVRIAPRPAPAPAPAPAPDEAG